MSIILLEYGMNWDGRDRGVNELTRHDFGLSFLTKTPQSGG